MTNTTITKNCFDRYVESLEDLYASLIEEKLLESSILEKLFKSLDQNYHDDEAQLQSCACDFIYAAAKIMAKAAIPQNLTYLAAIIEAA